MLRNVDTEEIAKMHALNVYLISQKPLFPKNFSFFSPFVVSLINAGTEEKSTPADIAGIQKPEAYIAQWCACRNYLRGIMQSQKKP